MIKLGTQDIKLPYSKAYLGEALKWQAVNYIDTEFNGLITPTSWTAVGSSSKDYTGTNSYGEWRIHGISGSIPSSKNAIKYAFDNNTSTYFIPTQGIYDTNFVLYLPANSYIKPTEISITAKIGKSEIRGQDENGNWETIAQTNVLNSTTEKYNITTEKFYKAFSMNLAAYSMANISRYTYEFQITKGTIKQYN